MKTGFLSFVILISQLFFAHSAQAQTIRFKNDLKVNLCTGFPNGTWGHCCYEHDIFYWAGGSFQKRKSVDTRLKQCVNASGGPGDIMYEGVRRFGIEFWSSAWETTPFSALTLEEQEMVNAEVNLWKNLGRPPTFEFIHYETAMFPVITPKHQALIKERIQELIKTPEYARFYNTYVKVTGQKPATIVYH